MDKLNAAYYFSLAAVFLAAFIGFDYFNVIETAAVFFIAEFASVFISRLHYSALDWQNNAPYFLRRKNTMLKIAFGSLKIAFGYLFFILWAAAILLANGYFFVFIAFLASTALKFVQISRLDVGSLEYKKAGRSSAILTASLFIAMAILLWANTIVVVNPAISPSINAVFGLVYYSLAGTLTMALGKL